MAWVNQTRIIGKEMSIANTINYSRTLASKLAMKCILGLFVSLRVWDQNFLSC